jgi:sigma-E factor negative regulatory protein RseC
VIVERATVIEIDGDDALVRCHAQAGCQRCAQGRGCGGGIMAKWLGDRLQAVRVGTDGLALRPGDEVAIALEERGLVQASAAVYLVPLLAAMAGAAAAGLGTAGGDGPAVAGAIAGFCGGVAWSRRFARRRQDDGRFRPRVLGGAPAARAGAGEVAGELS